MFIVQDLWFLSCIVPVCQVAAVQSHSVQSATGQSISQPHRKRSFSMSFAMTQNRLTVSVVYVLRNLSIGKYVFNCCYHLSKLLKNQIKYNVFDIFGLITC